MSKTASAARVAAKTTDTVSIKEITGEDISFASLLDESFKGVKSFEGSVVEGTVVGVDAEFVTLDVGLKSEGRIPLREFSNAGQPAEIKVGDKVEVFIERMENKDGEAGLSREKARREESWVVLEKQHKANERVTGTIFGRVKGGFTVDLGGAVAFLPGSQVDIRPVRDVGPLMGQPQPFLILKMDRARGNIVVSRRAVLEESRAEARSELVSNLKEGQELQGVVKNITDYGAFIDLGGVDGLLHVTDISWKRINHPSEVLSVGQTLNVKIIRFNEESQRISLGIKQLDADPWEGAASRFTAGQRYKGRVTNIADYGAFIELEDGIEGLIHVSEMSWTKKNIHPGKILSTSQEVEVMVLDVDMNKRRISLGLKQCGENPWIRFAESRKVGDTLEGEIRNITEFGLFVGIGDQIDGMVHMSDLSWTESGEDAIKKYAKGETIAVKVLEIDGEKERVSLGVKQLGENPGGVHVESGSSAGGVAKGSVVTCTVSAITSGGIEVTVGDEKTHGFIKKGDLSRERSEQRPDRFAVGEKVDAKVIKVDRSGKLDLSVKAREIDEDKAAMAEYGSSDSGASLGDILGAALRSKADAAAPAKSKKSKGDDAE
ncbi:MAG: 30S ribosomal protein S1 [Alphaproteobacteria bacterium]|nr:30S ribosomal protein S1 [Alphaproteobacteria bacterium]MDE2336033.1 30S ribosomal protein S1 [Alphaproteobacteria bacterium]